MALDREKRPLRVMWLLNHTSARKFEISALQNAGINEIFLPKIFPQDPVFRNSSIDYSLDSSITIPESDLKYLNSVNWYSGADKKAIDIANRYFDIAFFIVHQSEIVDNFLPSFKGALIWRAYGLDKSLTYSKLLKNISKDNGARIIKSLGNRFYFGEAYSHLAEEEDCFLRERKLFLPLGLHDCEVEAKWNGSKNSILFVCPDIGFSRYYENIYNEFIRNFGEFPYVISGAQSVEINDNKVIGFVGGETHQRNMQEMRVMFYHSQEPNHIHYHPFEAVRVGMPLVFMAGGMLDRMGGENLPGRCLSTKQAQEKISRILNNDWVFIEKIRSSQTVLLESMRFENCIDHWKDNILKVQNEILKYKSDELSRPIKKPNKRIAIIVPAGYRGGSLRGGKLLAQAILNGSCQAGEAADVVFCHLDDSSLYPEEEFRDMDPRIRRRPFNWRQLTASEARRAMRYAGQEEWEPTRPCYQIPDDGIRQLQDCDLWVVVSDRLTHPLLPIKPAVLMVYDYLQRYVPILPEGADQPYLDAARNATQVWVTTEFTQNDALQYAGVDAHRLRRLPMLAPDFSRNKHALGSANYFLWTTNLAPHKNHFKAIEALHIYYAELDGKLKCKVTGVGSQDIPISKLPHMKSARDLLVSSKMVQSNTEWLGELPDEAYQDCLRSAVFLWHAGNIDNGTFSVIEAASVGVPSLSSNYPAMREIDAKFQLNLAWMDANCPRDMAHRLKEMEQQAEYCRQNLPSAQVLQSQNVEHLAGYYWNAVRECL